MRRLAAVLASLTILLAGCAMTADVTSSGDPLTAAALKADATVTVPPPFGALDSAVDATTFGSTVSKFDNLLVSGWVADSTDGAPLSNVKAYIDGVYAGTPTMGIARYDIATGFGNAAYLQSGFRLSVSAFSLAVGTHTVTVVATNAGGVSVTLGPATFTVATATSVVTLFGAVDQAVDATTYSSVVSQSDSLLVTGWALNPAVTTATLGVYVAVYVDGSVVGYGNGTSYSRPDIAAAYGSAYQNRGYQFTYPASGLAVGSHTATVVIYTDSGSTATLGPVAFSVVSTPSPDTLLGAIDQAVDARTSSSAVLTTDNLLVSGWAVDLKSSTPASSVKVYVDGTYFATATIGQSRSDVATLFSTTSYPVPGLINCGYTLTAPASSLTAGVHSVTVQASNASGTTVNLTTLPITVTGPLPPIASPGGPYVGAPNIAVSFNGAGSTDPQNQSLTYSWNFGDGATAKGVTPTHVYAETGTYNVSLTVTDPANLTSTATTTATISTLPPVANPGGPYTGKENNAITFSGAASTDPQGQTLTYAWKFGDGSTGTGVSPSHAYSGLGTFTVTLTVTDVLNLTGTATTMATVTAAPPVASAGGPYNGKSGVPISFSGAASTDPQGQTLTYAWSFGDGTTGTGVYPTHAYTSAGLYTASLTATNTSGVSSTATASVTVLPTVALGTGAGLTGNVHSGSQTVLGAHVYLFAANTTAYGQSSNSLLSSSVTGHSDSIGAYVLTDSNGNFVIPAGYGCATPSQLYLYTLGGTIGSYTNPAAGLLAALGPCAGYSSIVPISVNEVSTVAAAYSLAGFSTDAVHIADDEGASGNSYAPQARAGMANAFATVNNLVGLSTGTALSTTPAGNGTVPQATLNTLANILNACVSSTGSSSPACTVLFADAMSSGSTGTAATDTATAAINIAHHPGVNVAALYGLQTTASPFTPALTAQPNDFTVGLQFSTPVASGSVNAIAIDIAGNVWLATNTSASVLQKLSNTGVLLSPAAGYSVGQVPGSFQGITIDSSGSLWALGYCPIYPPYGSYAKKFSSTGTQLAVSNAGGCLGGLAIDGAGDVFITNLVYPDGVEVNSSGAIINYFAQPGGSAPSPVATYVAINGSGTPTVVSPYYQSVGSYKVGFSSIGPIAFDGAGSLWVSGGSAGVKITPAGVQIPFTGSGGMNGAGGIAIDGAGNAWVANSKNSSLIEFSNAGVALSPSTGYSNGMLPNIYSSTLPAIDGSGNIWIANQDKPTLEIIGLATPVITPIAAGLPVTPTSDGSSKLGTRP